MGIKEKSMAMGITKALAEAIEEVDKAIQPPNKRLMMIPIIEAMTKEKISNENPGNVRKKSVNSRVKKKIRQPWTAKY